MTVPVGGVDRATRVALQDLDRRVGRTTGWVAFTPSWTNVTIGNATNVGMFRYVAGDLHVVVHMVFGSTTSFTGSVQFVLPDSASALTSADITFSGVGRVKNGTTDEAAHCAVDSGATFAYCFSVANDIGAAAPFTWATGDDLYMQIVVGL